MELRIDTKRDSVEDIRKAIRFLEQFLEQQTMPSSPTNLFEQNRPVMTTNSAQDLNPLNMFNEPLNQHPPPQKRNIDDEVRIIEY